MNKSVVRTLPAVLTLALASIGLSAIAQTTAPTTTQKAENAGEKAWDATKADTKKAVDATESGSKKAWDATKHGTKKAVKGTEHAVDATGKAIGDAGSAAASGTRKVGDKIGEQIPGTAQNEAVKSEAKKP
jgi:hypothetical protein